jgi:hypothetical protein
MKISIDRLQVKSNLCNVLSSCMLGIVMGLAQPASALSPPKSPEQMSRDEMLIERASLAITPRVMRCFNPPKSGSQRAFTVQFFLGRSGHRPAQFKIIGIGPGAYPARSGRERAAIRAIKTCAPYTIPAELRSWGGFWATVDFW